MKNEDRVRARLLCESCWAVLVGFGFRDEIDIPKALELLKKRGAPGADGTSYFLSRSTVVPTLGAVWRTGAKLYANMHRNASSTADFLNLPPNRVIELGAKVQI